MQAIYFDQGQAGLKELPLPEPGPEDALIQVKMAGICNTDLQLLQGYYDFRGVPGHEFVGTVFRAGQRQDLLGKRVVADINCTCGRCSFCQSGLQNHCLYRQVIGIKERPGAFADYLSVPLQNLHLLPQGLPDRKAVFAEPLAAALQVTQQIQIKASQKIAVLGDGKLGLLAALALRLYSPGVVLLGKHQDKLQIARKQGVSTQLIGPQLSKQKIVEQCGLFDVLLEATGSSRGLELALDLVRPGGTIVLKTTVKEKTTVHLAKLVVNEQLLLGSRCGDLQLALDFLARSLVEVEPLIEAEYPFAEFDKALKHAQSPGAKKVLLKMEE